MASRGSQVSGCTRRYPRPVEAEPSGLQGTARPYTAAERLTQLRTFAAACRSASILFGDHHVHDMARAFASLCEEADRLLADGFANADLRELGAAIPERVPWMHPKYLDFDAPREPWQEALANYVQTAERLALELRALASFDGE